MAEEKTNSKIKIILWVAVPVVLVAGTFFATRSYRVAAANHYLEKGDIALEAKKYGLAELQYDKALMLNSKNTEAISHKELADKAKSDVSILKSFYEERGNTEQIERIAIAEEVPQYETEALRRAKTFIEEGEYQYAAMVAKTATEMAPDYAEAKTYLEFANQRISSAM